jgi:hypothetical protein
MRDGEAVRVHVYMYEVRGDQEMALQIVLQSIREDIADYTAMQMAMHCAATSTELRIALHTCDLVDGV